MQELGLPVIFHSGAFALAPRAGDHGRAEHFGELLASFPRLTVVMAHLAFGDFDACAELARAHPNVFFDCCFVVNGVDRPPAVGDEEAVAAFRRIGADRVMFGSDYPWFDPVADAERIRRLPLTDTEKRAILHDNASRILGL
jgi:predicted TIM-barrel fold metal-dependent hydrolase